MVVGGLKQLLSGKGPVAINQDTELGLKDVRAILADESGSRETVIDEVRRRLYRQRGIHIGKDVDLMERVAEEQESLWVEQDSRGDAEQKAARKFGLPVEDLCLIAYELWHWSLTRERDFRIRAVKPKPSSARSLQALRGHITRDLYDELAEPIAEYKLERYLESPSD